MHHRNRLRGALGLALPTRRPREAIAVVHVDGKVSPEVLAELRRVPAVEQAKAIRLFLATEKLVVSS